MAKKANSVLQLIARNLHNTTRYTRALAYTSLVRPRIEYSAAVWDPQTQKDTDILERVNRRAARVVYRKSYWDKAVSPTKLLQELGWKTLETRREHQRLSLMYKINNCLVAIPPTQLISPARTLRGHSKKFQTIGTTCDTVKYYFFPRTTPVWNYLSEDIVSAPSFDSFKSRLSRF